MPAVTIQSSGSTLLVAADYNRGTLLVTNSDTTNNLHVNFGGTATTNDGYIPPGGNMTLAGRDVYKGAINAIASASTIVAKYSASSPGA